MRKALKVLFVVALAIPTMATALVGNSKHNLSSTAGATAVHTTDATVDMCKFCHLVHDGSTTAGALWARKAPVGTAFSTPNATVDGTPLPATLASYAATPGTTRCLSCHDGSVALNIITNQVSGDQIVGANTTWLGGASISTSGNSVFLIGNARMQNLNGQHPVGIPFAGAYTYNGITSRANATEYATVATSGCSSGALCVANGGVPTAGTYIKLYGTSTAPGLECGSCHDPHADNVTNNTTFFLRVPLGVANGRCGACHKK